ncbi:MAG: hypothetical protein NUV63_11880 [Gallionella sp.]|nr:hypothetical protein [Gallionella sp.]
MKYFLIGTFVSIAILSGCSSSKYSVAQNETDVRQNISEISGYPGCPDCSMVKTYTSPALLGYSWRSNADNFDNGYLTGRIYIGITNNQPDNRFAYFLKIDETNSNEFAGGETIFNLIDQAGKEISLADLRMNEGLSQAHREHASYQMKGYFKDRQCQGNVGRSCWWSDYLLLSPQIMNEIMKSGKPLTVFIGVNHYVAANDGFNRKTVNNPVGTTISIKNEYIAAFLDEMKKRNISTTLN